MTRARFAQRTLPAMQRRRNILLALVVMSAAACSRDNDTEAAAACRQRVATALNVTVISQGGLAPHFEHLADRLGNVRAEGCSEFVRADLAALARASRQVAHAAARVPRAGTAPTPGDSLRGAEAFAQLQAGLERWDALRARLLRDLGDPGRKQSGAH